MVIHRHRRRHILGAAGDVAAHLCVGACAQFVNHQLALAWDSASYVGYADVCPAVKLADHLIIAQVASDDGLDNLVRRHVGHTKVASAADTMLAGVF